MTIDELEKILKKSWSKETSYFPDGWSETNPVWGQCAVSALIVNNHFGGEIVWAEAVLPDGRKISHYFNLIDGREVDLTRSQFPPETRIPAGVEKKETFTSVRECLLSDGNFKKRYEILKKKVEDNLKVGQH